MRKIITEAVCNQSIRIPNGKPVSIVAHRIHPSIYNHRARSVGLFNDKDCIHCRVVFLQHEPRPSANKDTYLHYDDAHFFHYATHVMQAYQNMGSHKSR